MRILHELWDIYVNCCIISRKKGEKYSDNGEELTILECHFEGKITGMVLQCNTTNQK